MDKVLEKENTFETVIEDKNAKLIVELGWDVKQAPLKDRVQGRLEVAMTGVSAKSHDLNLAAILEYADGTKPELVFHRGAGGRGADEAGSVVLGSDDRTGFGGGSDETIRVSLEKVPEGVKRILLFMNIGGANLVGQSLADVDGVFVQIQNADDRKVYFREEDAFKDECAKDYCCYTFAALCREEAGWVLRGMARYSCEDSESETLRAMMQ